MNAPIPSRPGPLRVDPRLEMALALRHEAMQLNAQLDYFMRHELAEMRAKAAYFGLLCQLADCRAADRLAQR